MVRRPHAQHVDERDVPAFEHDERPGDRDPFDAAFDAPHDAALGEREYDGTLVRPARAQLPREGGFGALEGAGHAAHRNFGGSRYSTSA
jgi:hypothetical protein